MLKYEKTNISSILWLDIECSHQHSDERVHIMINCIWLLQQPKNRANCRKKQNLLEQFYIWILLL